MFRKATKNDLPEIYGIYSDILTLEEAGKGCTGWKRGVYPTPAVADRSLEKDELFVLEKEGKIVACARINTEQDPAYKFGSWKYHPKDDEVIVLHTLIVSPNFSGQGYGKSFVNFFEQYASEHGYRYLRLDTNFINIPARNLYRSLGYTEAGVVQCNFCNLGTVGLVCIEKKI